MASHSRGIPHIESNPDMSDSSQTEEEEHMYPEITYALPHEDLNKLEESQELMLVKSKHYL
jgi:hypothetical protein